MGNDPQVVDRLEPRDLALRAISVIVLLVIAFAALTVI